MTDTFRQGERLTAAKLNSLLARPVSITQVTSLQDTLDLKASVEALTAGLAGKSATGHTHPAAQIIDSTAAGRALLTAADAAAQRTALGLGTAATQASTAFVPSSGAGLPVPVSLWVGGTMTDGETLGAWIAPYACSFPAGASGSYFNAGTAATGSTTISVKKNGTQFATILFAASGTVATVTISSTTSFAVNDVMTFVGPATKDATLADVRGNLVGTRT